MLTLLAGLAARLSANQVRYAEVQVTAVRNRMAGISYPDLASALTARRRDRGPRRSMGGRSRPGRGAGRARHRRGRRPGAAGLPGPARHRAGGVPDLERVHRCGALAARAPAAGPAGRPGPVTLATDDPGMFHTSLNDEYLRCHREFGPTAAWPGRAGPGRGPGRVLPGGHPPRHAGRNRPAGRAISLKAKWPRPGDHGRINQYCSINPEHIRIRYEGTLAANPT